MQIELIKNPPILPGHQESSCTVNGYSVKDETRPTEEQIRLLLSWRAVLTEMGSGQLGGSQW